MQLRIDPGRANIASERYNWGRAQNNKGQGNHGHGSKVVHCL